MLPRRLSILQPAPSRWIRCARFSEHRPKPSIFAELFPEENKPRRRLRWGPVHSSRRAEAIGDEEEEEEDKKSGQGEAKWGATGLKQAGEIRRWLDDPAKPALPGQPGQPQDKTPTQQILDELEQDEARLNLADDFQPWLMDDFGEASLAEQAEGASNRNEGPALLVLNGTTPNLLESDFYRNNKHGKHIDGWSRGIEKVMQACDSVTYEPQGDYFILFDSYAAAKDYASEMDRRHKLARRGQYGAPAARAFDSASPLPRASSSDPDPAAAAATRAFTLAPPGKALHMTLYEPSSPLVRAVRARWARARARPPAEAHVLVAIDGTWLRAGELVDLIAKDTARRNIAWRTARKLIHSVRPALAGTMAGDRTAAGAGAGSRSEEPLSLWSERHNRFLVAFDGQDEAQRFARMWHKRTFYDAAKRRSLIINTKNIW